MSDLQTRLEEKLDGEALASALARMRDMPRYASEWERRVVAIGTDDGALNAAADVLRSLTNVWACPAEWLFLLAWSNSVDVWDEDWPEAVKRSVIDASWEVHRFKGTRFAIRTGLAALGLSVKLTAWHEADPPLPRATFTADVFVTEDTPIDVDNPAYSRLEDRAVETIIRTKPLTRHFAHRFALRSRTRMRVGVHARAKIIARAPDTFKQPQAQRTTMFHGVNGRVLITARSQ